MITILSLYCIGVIVIFSAMCIFCKCCNWADTEDAAGYPSEPYKANYGVIVCYSLLPLAWVIAIIECYYCYKYGHNSTYHDFYFKGND